MAAKARHRLARHRGKPAAHLLKVLAVGVERLQDERHIGGGFEERAAVGLDVDFADHHTAVPGALHADQIVAAAVLLAALAGAVLVVEHPKILDSSLRHTSQSRTVVDVDEVDQCRLLRFIHTLRNLERFLALLDRQRLQIVERVIRRNENRPLIVVDVHIGNEEVLRVRVVLHRHQHALLRERIGVEEELTRVVDKPVCRHWRDRLSPARQTLDGALLFAASLGDIEEDEFALPANAMVSGDDSEELGRRSRHRLREEQGIGPIGVGTVELLLIAAVRIHRHENAREVVRAIRIFPAQIEAAPVREHDRIPVVVLIEAQPT